MYFDFRRKISEYSRLRKYTKDDLGIANRINPKGKKTKKGKRRK